MELGFGTLPAGVSEGATVTAEVVLTDNDPLTVTVTGPTVPVETEFDITITFSEEVSGFGPSVVMVAGGTATVTGSGAQYAATVTPSGAGTVTVEIAAGAVQDDAGNGNQASQRLSVTVPLNCSTGSAVTDRTSNPGL